MSEIQNNRVRCNICKIEFKKYEKYILYKALDTERTIRVGGILMCINCEEQLDKPKEKSLIYDFLHMFNRMN